MSTFASCGFCHGLVRLATRLATWLSHGFWQRRVAAHQLTSPEFSFFITRFVNDPSADGEEESGVLTLGRTNSTFFDIK